MLVTHDMGAVRRYCTRAMMIEKGRVVVSGKPEKVAQEYQKLFDSEALSAAKSEDNKKEKVSKHWGTGSVTCLKPEIKVGQDMVTLTLRYRANANIPNLVTGFTVFDSAGNNILEDNTDRKGFKVKPPKSGKTAEFVWTFPNILKNGDYTVSLACCDESLTTFYDWYNEAAKFRIVGKKDTSSITQPITKLEAKKEG